MPLPVIADAPDARYAVALRYYRQHYGPATLADIRAAADPRRNFHTLAELRSLAAAGIPVRGA